MIVVGDYNELIRKYTIIFGTLFNNIRIKRYDTDGTELQEFKVPLAYGPAEHHLAVLEADPDKDKLVATMMPRMAFEIVGMDYDPGRKLTTLNRIQSANKRKYVNEGVPWNFQFQLTIMSKTTEDGYKIVEAILPYFTPDWNITTDLIDEFDLNYDVNLNLNSVTPTDEYESDLTTRRVVKWTMDFTMKGFLVSSAKDSTLIKLANVSIFGSLDANNFMEKITVKPGLDANGNPTTDENVSITYTDINPTDNYGVIVKIEDE